MFLQRLYLQAQRAKAGCCLQQNVLSLGCRVSDQRASALSGTDRLLDRDTCNALAGGQVFDCVKWLLGGAKLQYGAMQCVPRCASTYEFIGLLVADSEPASVAPGECV